MNNIDNLRDTIVPKSDQLNSDDLIGITKIIRINGLKRHDSTEQPLSVCFYGMNGRPYKPCLTMRRLIIALWGDDGRKWIGRSIKLYSDPEVKNRGVKVGGIRISHLSDLPKDSMKISLTESRGKKVELTILKLQTYPEEAFEKNRNTWIEAIKAGKLDIDTLIDKAGQTGILTDEQIEQLKKETE